jgi:LAS superfamily LD-carboxypeptidase LdcB
MSLKSLFEKFQSSPKIKNNWLMPFRKSGVKVNLKSIRFDRAGGFSPKNSGIQSSIRRKSTLPNLQKVDSFLSNPVDLTTAVKRDEELFSKVHNTRKPFLSTGIIFLIFLVLIISSAGLYLFSNNKLKEKQSIVEACNTYVAEQKIKGFVTSVPCDVKLSWYEYPFADSRAKKQFDTIKSTINKQISDQQIQLTQLDKDIRITKQNLSSIDPDFEKQLPTGSGPVPNTIKDKQNLLNSLKALLATKDELMSTTLTQFNYLIKLSPGVDSQAEQAQTKTFENLAKNEKYTKYQSLFDGFNSFKQKLVTATPDGWFAKSLNSPDVYAYKILFGDDYKTLFETAKFPDTTAANSDPISITGDDGVDKHIIEIAEKRGYKKRPLANEAVLISFGGDRLQPTAKTAFDKLVAGAAEDGIRIGLVSGYRSPNEQKSLFVSRFRGESLNINKGKTYTSSEIISGNADEAINNVLSASSIPGYSRHHTGYAVDITDLNGKKDFTQFADTTAYRWISANNYYNAKRFGFIPSYPPGASNQGPEPESWEYVYVGVDAVK